MSDKKRKVPKLRFPGFTDAWEQRKLGEVVGVNSGRDYKHLESGDFPVYGTGGYMLSVSEALSYTEDAIGIGRKGTIDKPFILKAPFWTVDTLFYCIPKGENDLEFVFSLFQNITWKKLDESTGVPSLSKQLIDNVRVTIPSEKEQAQLGYIFESINTLISLHQRKLDNVKMLKKSLLQKLFPKDGEKIPELRFPGFTDDWEQRKLGDMGKVSMCKRVFKSETSEIGEVPFYKIGTFGEVADSYISKDLFEEYRDKYSYPKVGDILISASGSIGRTVVYTGQAEYFQDSNIVWLDHGGKIDNRFLLAFYSVVKWSGIEGSTIKRLYNENILNTQISLPSLSEQATVGNFFREFDSLISLHQRKLDHLKELKKGLLQQMFV